MSKRVVIVCQARTGSTRFPGKVLKPLDGMALMGWTVHAAKAAKTAHQVVVATSTLEQDNSIAQWCVLHNVHCYRGSEDDVLSRCFLAAREHKADLVVRLTCDCPFVDPAVIDQIIHLQRMTGADYVSNVDPPSWPDGLDVECMTMKAVEAAYDEADSDVDRDCWPQFIARNRHRFKAANLQCPLPGMHKERWVCDTQDDFKFCEALVEAGVLLGSSYTRILSILEANPHLRDINNRWSRNERFYDGVGGERLPARTFERSARVFERAIKTIPFGAQTFSKSHLQFPTRRAPLYVSHADGGYIFDVDGNRYVDLVNAVLPVVLGYRDDDVDTAIRDQLSRGISFSLATELEVELAELLKKHIPCAEMVKFGKSGTDVTTAAIRLARACTGRDHVLLSGYHGWSDWSMGPTDRNLGIPAAIRELTHRFDFGSMEQVRSLFAEHKGQIAAVIVEPNGEGGYLKWLKEFCRDEGALLIFDEIITGFRYDLGGAQKLFRVTPDLATFGKAMANGMPISALVGKRRYMKRMQPPDNIFYSGTFFGETLSIAAAIATIKKMDDIDGISKLWKTGGVLAAAARQEISLHGLTDHIKLSGLNPRMIINFTGPHKDQIRTLFMIEMIQNGVLIINSHNVSCAHGPAEIKRVETAWKHTCQSIRDHIDKGTLNQAVHGSIVEAAPLRATA